MDYTLIKLIDMCNICNKPWCGKCPQPTNPSNKTVVVPVSGVSAYELWLSYNPDLDPNINPDSPWTESYWLDNYVKINNNYEQFEI